MADSTNTAATWLERRVQAPDRRTLAVAEWGSPDGLPLVSLHGTPGGRLGRWRDPRIYARFGVRRLTYDRAGYGESTRRPGRRVADVVEDVLGIVDALGIDRFAVTGGSGGGPHALAIAAGAPDRVIRCLADVSIAPFDADGLDWFAAMTPGNVEEIELSLKGESAIRAKLEPERAILLERLAAGRADFLTEGYVVSESDLEQMAKDQALFAEVLADALREGADGWIDDDIAFVHRWGFDVGDIAVPTSIWYGRDDNLVPAAHGDWLAAHIPGAEAFVSDFGHLGDDTDVERQLTWLTAGSQ